MGDSGRQSRPQTPIRFIPPAPRGDNRPGDGVPARPSVPRIRALNIIPSELCNSRRNRHLPLEGHQLLMGQKPAKTACRASDYTIRIMLRTLRRQGAKVLPSNSRVRRRQERAWRQWPACTRPFASPAPGRGIGAPISPIPLPRCRSASAASIFKRHLPHQPQCSASILPPYAAKLRVGPSSKASSRDKPASSPLTPFLQGRV